MGYIVEEQGNNTIPVTLLKKNGVEIMVTESEAISLAIDLIKRKNPNYKDEQVIDELTDMGNFLIE